MCRLILSAPLILLMDLGRRIEADVSADERDSWEREFQFRLRDRQTDTHTHTSIRPADLQSLHYK